MNKKLRRFLSSLRIIRANLIFRLHKFLANKNLVCHGCYGPCFKRGKLRRQNTAYVDDSKNFVFVCDECFDEIEYYWEERWDDYYSSRL